MKKEVKLVQELLNLNRLSTLYIYPVLLCLGSVWVSCFCFLFLTSLESRPFILLNFLNRCIYSE